MPIGSSNGNQYETQFDAVIDRPMNMGESTQNNNKLTTGLPNGSQTPSNENRPLVIIRHGDTEFTENNLAHGWTNEGLTPDGVQEVENQNLKDKPDVLITSDLKRAQQTADILGENHNLPVISNSALRTWNIGDFSGMPKDQADSMLGFYVNDPTKSVPGGESFQDFQSRVLNGVQDITSQYPGMKLGLVTHSKVQKILNAQQNGTPYSDTAESPGQEQTLNYSTNIEDDRNKQHSMSELAGIASDKIRGAADVGFNAIKAAGAGLNTAEDAVVKGVSVLPQALTDQMNRTVDTIYGAITLPGDVATGKVNPLSDEAVSRAKDLAQIAVGSPGTRPTNSLGSFAGFNSRMSEGEFSNFFKAITNSEGKTPNEIFKDTGWFKGPDNRWRYEIPDTGAELNLPEKEEPPRSWTTASNSIENIYHVPQGETFRLGDVLHHPELYQRYPEIADLQVKAVPFLDEMQGTKGGFGGSGKKQTLFLAPAGKEDLLSTTMHEIQHYIQKKEDFAKGGNPDMMEIPEIREFTPKLNKISDDTEAEIRRITGADVSTNSVAKTVNKLKRIANGQNIKINPDEIRVMQSLVNHPEGNALIQRVNKIQYVRSLLEEAKDKAFEDYQKLYGEVESRNVQTRLKDKIPKDIHPEYTQDIPTKESILIK